jgi:hypothetical protein
MATVAGTRWIARARQVLLVRQVLPAQVVLREIPVQLVRMEQQELLAQRALQVIRVQPVLLAQLEQ